MEYCQKFDMNTNGFSSYMGSTVYFTIPMGEEQYKGTNTFVKEMGYNNIRISGDIKIKSISHNSLRIQYELNFRKCHNMKMLLNI